MSQGKRPNKPNEYCRRLKQETLWIAGVPVKVYRFKRRWWIAAKKGQIQLTEPPFKG